MEKEYLVVHKYKNTGDAVYLVKMKDLANFTDHMDNREVEIYEWNSNNIGLLKVKLELAKDENNQS